MHVDTYAALNYVLGFLPSSAQPRAAAIARRRVRVETDRGRTYFAVVDASTPTYLAFRGFDGDTGDAADGTPSSFLLVDLHDGGVGLRRPDGSEERIRFLQGEELHGRTHVAMRHIRVDCDRASAGGSEGAPSQQTRSPGAGGSRGTRPRGS